MPIVVVGGGAIGGIVAARLAASGTTVTLVEADAARREALRARGITLSGVSRLTAAPTVSAPEEFAGPLETALLAVKCPQTGAALEFIAPRLTPEGVAVSLQNGFEVYRLADRLGTGRTVGAVVTLSGYVEAPGQVVHSNLGALALGHLDPRRTPQLERLAGLLAPVCPIELSADLQRTLWSKAALAAVWFATALVDSDVVDILEERRYRPALGALAAEVAATALAQGIECVALDGFDPMVFLEPGASAERDDVWAQHLAFWHSIPQARTGVWRDLALYRRPTEVACILQPVIAFAAEHGRRLPRIERLVELTQCAERGERELSWETLELLRETHEQSPQVTGAHP